MPEELRAQAREQLARLRATHEAEREELESALRSRRSARNTRSAVVWVVTFAVLLVAWFPILALYDRLSAVAMLAIVAFTGVTVNRTLFTLSAEVSPPRSWYRERIRPPDRDEPAFAARCAVCGGEAKFADRATETICPWCAATLVVPREVSRRALDRAADHVAEARVISREEQRKAFAMYHSMVAPGFVMAMTGAVGITALLIGGALLPRSSGPLPFTLLVVAMVMAIPGGVALVFVERR